MEMKSPAFEHTHSIPKKYTCEGQNVSPQLFFEDIPEGCKSLVLLVDDPDAPKGNFAHWIAWNIDPKVKSLDEGVQGLMQGVNGFRQNNYRGPCPPPGNAHHYFFKAYALDSVLDLPEGSTKSQVEQAMEGHILSMAELVGTYKRGAES